MSIIREYQYGGAMIRVDNAAYKHLSAQEMEERKQTFLAKAGKLCWEQIEENERKRKYAEQCYSAAGR